MLGTRRQFLTYLGVGTYSMVYGGPQAQQQAKFPASRPPSRGKAPFQAIQPSIEDKLVLPKGYKYDVVAAHGDMLGGSHAKYGKESFGAQNDFLAYVPIDALSGGSNNDEGLLWANHEAPSALFTHSDWDGNAARTESQIIAEKLSVGGSVLHIRREGGVWKRVPDSKYTRRFTALYPEMRMTGPAKDLFGTSLGTLANCSGGRTPWHTILSCEENYQLCNPAEEWGWGVLENQRIDERRYGWIVEVDPFGELGPQKHSCLGRFSHENAAWRLSPNGKLVVYMGDDAMDQYLYKFVSAEKYDEKATRAEKSKLLTQGTLYAADFAAGKWLPLDIERSPALKKAGFRDQADVLVRAREASAVLKATPIDRPEDCEVHPLDGSLYVALTNNAKHGNLYGHIVRLVEGNDDPENEQFRYEIFLAGGPQSGLACPDNLAFDRKGNLWVVTDVSGKSLNKGAYSHFGNNGMFFVPTYGPGAGDAFQFASGPVDAELTGPWFSEKEDTLFLSVQHPGELSTTRENPTSRWPSGGASVPRSAVVAISGFSR